MQPYDYGEDSQVSEKPHTERRNGTDRRCGTDRRNGVRYEACRRKNHGRRKEDKDLWKESLEFE